MEVVALLLIVLAAWIFLKIFAAIFHVGIFMLALPFKLLALALSTVFIVLIAVPLGLVAGLASLIAIPFILITPLLPFVLVGLAVWLFVRGK